MTQLVAVKFQGNSSRRYTYRNDTGVAFKPGDKGDVETDRGVVTVEVAEADVPQPKNEVGEDVPLRTIVHFVSSASSEAPAAAQAPPPVGEPAPRETRKPAATKKEVRELAADISKGKSPEPEGIDEQ